MHQNFVESETDEFGFKRYEGDFIFIACSGDAQAEREEAERVLRDVLVKKRQKGVRTQKRARCVDPTAYVVNANLSTIPAAGAEPECSTSLTEGEIMAHTRAADDFRAIRARLEDLR
jgi:hypothetical protein